MSDTTHAYDAQPIGHAMRMLLGVCDGARKQDGSGFSAYDRDFGERLASSDPSSWSPKMVAAGYKLAIKYRKQLSGFGIDVSQFPQPPAPPKVARRVIWDGSAFVLAFPFDPTVIAEVKRIPNVRFQRAPVLGWVAPFGSRGAVMAFAQQHGFETDESVAKSFAAEEKTPQPGVHAEGATDRWARVCDVHPEDAEALCLKFPYDEKIVGAAKAHASWQKAARMWRVPLVTASKIADVQRFLGVWGFTVTTAALARIADIATLRAETIAASKSADAVELDIAGLNATLRPFQSAGVFYALKHKRTYIADEPGLGKTIQAIATILKAQAFPAVVVCPATLKTNWYREWRKFAPGISVEVLEGTKSRPTMADVLIVNYDILVKARKKDDPKPKKGQRVDPREVCGPWVDEILRRDPQAVVADEAHYLKNGKAARTRACGVIFKDREYRLLLTGTPVLNSPSELVAPLHMIDRLRDLGGYGYFVRRYCGYQQTAFGTDVSGAANLEELNDALRAVGYIRRLKKDVLTELPEKQRTPLVLPIDNRREYQLAESKLLQWIRGRVTSDRAFMASIAHYDAATQAQMIAARKDDKEERARRAETLVRIESLKQVAARGKLAAAISWIEDFIASGEKLLVFATHTEVIREVAQHFGWPTITGADDNTARQAAVDRFQGDPSLKGIMLNMQAGGVGLTLTAASNSAFLELGWTPGVHDQAEDRCHRIGQRNAVTAWYFLGEDTIDEDNAAMLDAKRAVVNATTDGDAADRASVFGDVLARLEKRAMAAEECAA